jgi:hypothetical protein
MMFGQLSGRDSLRDLLTCISAHSSKYHHLGFGKNVSRSNLSDANELRNYRIYEEYALALIKEARSCCTPECELSKEIEGNVYAVDSTTVDLCLSVFWWATFRTTKAAIKLHTVYDIRTSIPSFVLITPASVHDVNALDYLNYEIGSHYVLDRGYIDFKRLYAIHTGKSYFVTRSKDNMKFKRLSSVKANKKIGIVCDQIIRLTGKQTSKSYPENLRRIRYYDNQTGKTFVFLTNNLNLPAEQIAQLYKYRWSIELFFKWIKQHLKIKAFWGTNENAVKTQVYIAIITYCLVALVKSKLKVQRSTYEILQIIGVSLLDKTPLSLLLHSSLPELQNDESQYLLNFEGY